MKPQEGGLMVTTVIDSVVQTSQIYLTQLNRWNHKADFSLQMGPYTLKIAQTKADVIECFKLRHEVFCKEMAGRTTRSGMDYDEYDLFCDHLIIVHEDLQKIVGTYRLNFSDTAKKFYTDSEFYLSQWILKQKQPFIELGRACIQSEHRRGSVISLLWRGIAEYMKVMNAELLIGCSSVKVTDARSAALIYKNFEMNKNLSSEIFSVRQKYEMDDFIFWLMIFSQGLTAEQVIEAEEKTPSLLKSYIKAGAKVASYAALDKDFNCIDFVTILERKNLDSKLVKKFNT
jgi:putative hemolysin